MTITPRANSQEQACIRCAAPIPSYAGVRASELGNRWVHHAGQCADAGEITLRVRELAGQGALFGWHCGHVEQDGIGGATVCDVTSGDRAAYAAHMKSHGARPLAAPKMIRLRKRPPAASLPALELVTTKWIRWVERTYSEWEPGSGQTCAERERRGQFWSLADAPHSVWVVPFPEGGRPQRPVKLYVANGRCYQDFSEARRLRREGNRRHGLAA